MFKQIVYVCVLAMLISTLALGAEVRKLGVNDLSYVDFTSPAGKAVKGLQPIDVRSYGAVAGDNSVAAANVTAIQAAFDSLPTSDDPLSIKRGGTIYFPAGVWYINAEVLIKAGTTIRGAGRDATIIYNTTTTDNTFRVVETGTYGAYSISISDLQIYGSASATAGAGIDIGYNFSGFGAIGCSIRDVDIYGHKYGIAIGNSVNVKIDGVKIQNAATDGLISSGTANILTITNTYSSFNGQHGYNITNASYSAFLNTGSDSNGGDGYRFGSVNSVSLTGSGAESNTGHGLSVNTSGVSLSLIECLMNPTGTEPLDFHNLIGVTIVGGAYATTTAATYGIAHDNTYNISLIGAYIEGTSGISATFLPFASFNSTNVAKPGIAIGTFPQAGKMVLRLDNTVGDGDSVAIFSREGGYSYYHIIDNTYDYGISDNPGRMPLRIRTALSDNMVTLSGSGIRLGQAGTNFDQVNWSVSGGVADGGTIAHGDAIAPTAVVATGSVAGEMVSVTSLDDTTFTVAIKKHDGTAGTAQTIYWIAFRNH